MIERIGDAFADHACHLQGNLGPELAADCIGAERKWKTGGLLPPPPKVHDPMQGHSREEQLALVNQQARLNFLGLYRVQDFIERHRYDLDIRLKELQYQIRR